jgi:hypothetical protein
MRSGGGGGGTIGGRSVAAFVTITVYESTSKLRSGRRLECAWFFTVPLHNQRLLGDDYPIILEFDSE